MNSVPLAFALSWLGEHMTGKNITPLQRVYTPDEIAKANAKAEAMREQLRAEGVEAGIKIGERHKAAAYALGGFVIGAVIMGGVMMAVIERATMTTSAVAATAIARSAGDAGLPIADEAIDPSLEYQRNTQAAREEACRRGVRDPRTGRCPGEPGN
jgi:hypothetical protein